jgi:hypothetical protein
MRKQTRTRCRHCRCYFYADRRRHGHRRSQEYCGEPDCRRESHRASSKRYREGKRGDAAFKKKERLRVEKWQRENPGYKTRQREKSRKKEESPKKIEKNDVLRDLIPPRIEEEISVLRDLIKRQALIIKGFIATHHDVLRDEIYGVECGLYYRGLELSGMVSGRSEPPITKENDDESKRTNPHGPSAPCSGGFRLGGPPSGP